MTRPLTVPWLVDGTVPGDLGPAWGAQPAEPAQRHQRSLAATAEQVAVYRWLEHQLFATVGRWTAVEPDPAAAAVFSVLARQHAGHAELFADRLPVLAGIDADALAKPPAPWVALCDHLALMAGPGPGPERDPGAGGGSSGPPDARSPDWWQEQAASTTGRLVALGRVVLPRLTSTYAWHLRRVTPSDAPLVPTLRLVLARTRDAWTTVEAMVQDAAGAFGSHRDPGATGPGLPHLGYQVHEQLEALFALAGPAEKPPSQDKR